MDHNRAWTTIAHGPQWTIKEGNRNKGLLRPLLEGFLIGTVQSESFLLVPIDTLYKTMHNGTALI